MFRAWAAGRRPEYRPTMADLWALSIGWGEEPGVVVHNYPVAMQVLRII